MNKRELELEQRAVLLRVEQKLDLILKEMKILEKESKTKKEKGK